VKRQGCGQQVKQKPTKISVILLVMRLSRVIFGPSCRSYWMRFKRSETFWGRWWYFVL